MAKSDLIKEVESKDIAPDVKEKALAAIERIASTGECVYNADQTKIADSFDWNDTEEGYDFWYNIVVAKSSSFENECGCGFKTNDSIAFDEHLVACSIEEADRIGALGILDDESPLISSSPKRVKFTVRSNGYYGCSEPGEQAGEYVKAEEYDALLEQVRVMGEACQAALGFLTVADISNTDGHQVKCQQARETLSTALSGLATEGEGGEGNG
jgi:hypothetical protein